MENGVSEDLSDSIQRPESSDNDQRVYFVPLRWWKETNDSVAEEESDGKKGVLYTAAQASSSYASPMKLINTMFSSDLLLNLRGEEDGSSPNGCENNEVGVSGRDFALVSGEMWVKALKWHSDAKLSTKKTKTFLAAEDDMSDVYPLLLRLSVQPESSSLGVKITKKDNGPEFFRRANKIFTADSEMVSKNFNQNSPFIKNCGFGTFLNRQLYFPCLANVDLQKIVRDSQMRRYVILELQVYGLSDNTKSREGKNGAAQYSNGTYSSAPLMNGMNGSVSTGMFRSSSAIFGRSSEVGSLGLTGLQNLGNTCFMNSAIQCLAHTPKLVDYFLGDYCREINHHNPLGMDGEIALAFGELIRKLWAPGAGSVNPKTFKSKLGRFAPQFSGFNQHDSQELLAFLLDGLHEDLNRVKSKPYVEAKDGDGRPDSEVADEYWRNHLARNDSIIVDICQVYNNRILRYLEDPSDSLTLIRDGDRLVAYRLKKDFSSNGPLVIFMHQHVEEFANVRQFIHGKQTSTMKPFGIPLVGEGSVSFNGSDIHKLYLKLLAPFQRPTDGIPDQIADSKSITLSEESTEHYQKDNDEATERQDNSACSSGTAPDDSPLDAELDFYLTDEKGFLKDSKIVTDEQVPITGAPRRFFVIACWAGKQMEKQYDTSRLSTLPEVFKSGSFAKRPQESVSLYSCLEAFLKEEPLGPEDMWYCPGCKEHRQASKKLDLWRLPEILVIHLKRFSYTRYLKNKLETFVDFPTDDLDLATYISYKNGQTSHRYVLYAISNHFGSMGGGHYTAFVHHGGDQWYDFDDSHVHPVSQDKIKTSAAYVLFYRRVEV
ncbi:unnamed protein product [Linum tenue]|uniref:Ubiquitin carboxyl-terminal hydrolase n=1 Tax=Linum tenue TaxID=586396 RepID=A0AAV0QBM5_9ROSI|nr:unnamed protein product [Linum tenue]